MRILVIGTGITGLTAAYRLAARGHDVQVLEASDRAGGRARTLVRRKTGDRVDVGTAYYHSNYARTLGLIRELGLDRGLRKVTGDTRAFDPAVPGGSYIVDHRIPWFKPIGVPGHARLFAFLLGTLLRYPLDPYVLKPHPLDAVPAFAVARDPAVREYGVRLPYVIGMGAEPEQPSMLQILRLVRIILLTDYYSLVGGTDSLHQALAGRLKVRLEAPVEQLIVERGAASGVALAGRGEVLPADHVVVAVDGGRAASLLPGDWATEHAFLNSLVEPHPFYVATFFLDRPLEKGVWSYVTKWHAGRIGYLMDGAEKCPDMVPSGKSALNAYLVYPGTRDLVPKPDSEVLELALDELEGYLPGIGGWVEEAHLTRHEWGIPQFNTGHAARALDFLAGLDRRRGVSFCGDYYSGGYVEPGVWSVERALARL